LLFLTILSFIFQDSIKIKRRKPAKDFDKYFNKGGDSQNNPMDDLNDMFSQGCDDDDEHPSSQISEDTAPKTDTMNNDGGANVPDNTSHDYEGYSLGAEVESTGEFNETTVKDISQDKENASTDETALKVHVESSNEEDINIDYSGEAWGFQTTSTDYEISVGIKERYDNEEKKNNSEEESDSGDNDIYVRENISFHKFLSNLKELKPLVQLAENRFYHEITQRAINLRKCLMIAKNLQHYAESVNPFNYNQGQVREMERMMDEFYKRLNYESQVSQIVEESHQNTHYESNIDGRSMGFDKEYNGENNDTTDNYGPFNSPQKPENANVDDPNAISVHDNETRVATEDFTNDMGYENPIHDLSYTSQTVTDISHNKEYASTDESALKAHVESSNERNINIDYSGEAWGFQTTSTDYEISVGVKGQYDNEQNNSSDEESDSYDIESDSVDLDDSLSKMKKLKPLAQMAENKFVQEISQTSINLHKCLMLSNNLKYYTHVADSFNYNEPDVRKLKKKLKYDYRYRFYERINE